MSQTELAKTAGPARRLREIHQSVADILDEAAVRGQVTVDSARRLRAMTDAWASTGGSSKGAALLMGAQGTIGILTVTGENGSFQERVFAELRQLKMAWKAIADTLPLD